MRSRGQAESSSASSSTIDPNETDPVRGVTYAQQALSGLQKHATQGPWPKTVPPSGARIIRYSVVRQVSSAAPLPENAKTPVDGLRLPETVAAKLVAPTIDDKPLTDALDRRLELLVALLSAKRRGVFTAPKEVLDLDPQRFELMSKRLNKALAAATGASVYVNPAGSALVPGEEAQLEAIVANSGMAEVQIKQLKFRGLGSEQNLETAEKMLPGTEAAAEIKVTTPKTYVLSVPSAEHLYDGRLFGEPLKLEAELSIEGVSFSDRKRSATRDRAGC